MACSFSSCCICSTRCKTRLGFGTRSISFGSLFSCSCNFGCWGSCSRRRVRLSWLFSQWHAPLLTWNPPYFDSSHSCSSRKKSLSQWWDTPRKTFAIEFEAFGLFAVTFDGTGRSSVIAGKGKTMAAHIFIVFVAAHGLIYVCKELWRVECALLCGREVLMAGMEGWSVVLEGDF